MTAPEDSNTQVILIGLLVGLIAFFLARRSRGLPGRLIFGLLALGMLVPSAILFVGKNPWIVDARHRKFQTAYWFIRVGMTREEVLKELRDLYQPEGPHEPPLIVQDSAAILRIQINPTDSTDSAREQILLKMQEGRVTGKEQSSN